jgi:hypothetical protein
MASLTESEHTMNTHEIENLVFRASGGDPQAKATLRQQMEPQVVRLVRCILKTGVAHNAFGRRALAEAQRLGGAAPQAGASELLVGRVARRMLELAVTGAADTNQARRGMLDTVPAA